MICTATAGVALLTRQKCPKATWGKPQDPDAPERPPGKPKGGFPERRLNGAYKVPQAHLPPPSLPRFGGGERPPFFCKPIAPLTITMGQRLIFRRVAVPRPIPREAGFNHNFYSPIGEASFTKGSNLYACRRGVTFL